jgi:hypothetical protein
VGKGALCAVPTGNSDIELEKWWARGACHRARIRATRWLSPPYDFIHGDDTEYVATKLGRDQIVLERGNGLFRGEFVAE